MGWLRKIHIEVDWSSIQGRPEGRGCGRLHPAPCFVQAIAPIPPRPHRFVSALPYLWHVPACPLPQRLQPSLVCRPREGLASKGLWLCRASTEMSSILTSPPVSTNHELQRASRSLSLGSLAKMNTPTGTMTRLQRIMRLLACPVVLGSMALTGCSPPKSSYTVTKAVVTKVFSATDPGGHRFVAYAVD